MTYEKIVKGKFIDRPNRFVAVVELTVDEATKKEDSGAIVRAHVKNTGRCRELLLPGATVYLEDFRQKMGGRKLAFSLIAVEKALAQGNLLVNMDAQAPNKVTAEALRAEKLCLPGMGRLTVVKGEQRFADSRFDFYVEDEADRRGFLEVKGVTLEADGIARFPDAPTARGVKHVQGLIRARQAGYAAFILFVVQMKGMKWVSPNWATHPAFGAALQEAKAAGVNLLAAECQVTHNSLQISREIPVRLNEM